MLRKCTLICLIVLILFCLAGEIFSQGYCRISVQGLNNDRHLLDADISTECPAWWNAAGSWSSSLQKLKYFDFDNTLVANVT